MTTGCVSVSVCVCVCVCVNTYNKYRGSSGMQKYADFIQIWQAFVVVVTGF
jgi:hypothetical protein